MGKLIAFFGADNKVGTTQVSQCCAELIAKQNPELEILFVSADGTGGDDYYTGVGETVEGIRPFLAETLIDIDELKKKILYQKNLYILGGKNSPKTGDYFTPEMIELLLGLSRNKFDIIIIDAGCHIEEGISLGSLFSSDRIYLVLNQNESSLKRFLWHTDLYNQLGIEFYKYVINKYDKNSAYEIDYILDRLLIDKHVIDTVRVHKNSEEAEISYTSLINVKPNKLFKKDILKIAEEIIEYAR